MIRRLMVPLAFAVIACAGQALAQEAFPAPSSRQGSAPPPFPTNGAAPIAGGATSGPPPSAAASDGADSCKRSFLPLREDAEARGRLLNAARERRAPPDEACKLVGSFGEAETRMIRYVEANSDRCGIPQQILAQLRSGHANTEKMQKQVCAVALRMQSRASMGPDEGIDWRTLRKIRSAPVGDFPPYYGGADVVPDTHFPPVPLDSPLKR